MNISKNCLRVVAHLEFLVDALEAVNGAIQRSDFIAPNLELLLEILHFAEMRITFGGVLSLKLVL